DQPSHAGMGGPGARRALSRPRDARLRRHLLQPHVERGRAGARRPGQVLPGDQLPLRRRVVSLRSVPVRKIVQAREVAGEACDRAFHDPGTRRACGLGTQLMVTALEAGGEVGMDGMPDKGKCKTMKRWIDATYGRGVVTSFSKLPRKA